MRQRAGLRARVAGLAAALWLIAGVPASACGEAQTPCIVPLGAYYVALPQVPAPPAGRPVVVFFHGFGGTGDSIFSPASMTSMLTARGYAVLAPNGLMREGMRGPAGPSWSFRPEGPQQRDELAFTREVLADAVARFGLDGKRVLLTGFSIGGSLVWYLACKDPKLASAYAPVAGGFWRPHPQTCAGPIHLLHTHGWRDQTVPLEGRPLSTIGLMQGDIFEGLKLWREVNGCALLRPDAFSTNGPFWLRSWSQCTSGKVIDFALHPYHHDDVPAEWAGMALDWFESKVHPKIN